MRYYYYCRNWQAEAAMSDRHVAAIVDKVGTNDTHPSVRLRDGHIGIKWKGLTAEALDQVIEAGEITGVYHRQISIAQRVMVRHEGEVKLAVVVDDGSDMKVRIAEDVITDFEFIRGCTPGEGLSDEDYERVFQTARDLDNWAQSASYEFAKEGQFDSADAAYGSDDMADCALDRWYDKWIEAGGQYPEYGTDFYRFVRRAVIEELGRVSRDFRSGLVRFIDWSEVVA